MPFSTRKTSTYLTALALSLAFSAPLAFAQTSQGILAGVARDSSGAVLPGSKVTITNEDTREVRTTAAKSDGTYRLEAIPPGRYTVLIEQAGFDAKKATGVVINPSVTSSYDAVLSVGKVNDVVEVAAVSNAINLENGQITGIISANDIRSLPIFSLNPIELATTLPGIQTIVQPSAGQGAQGQSFSANGARPRANNFLIDGQEINDVAIAGQGFQPDIPGAYATVAVLSNSASAEFGRAGGAVTNVVTARGTNVFHGSAYDRYTGSGLNALSATQRQSKVPGITPPKKTRFDRHTYGFTAGGPIFKDKLFAFGAGQWQRYFGGVLEGRNELPDQSGVNQLKSIAAQTGTVQATQASLFGAYLSNYAYLNTFANTTATTANPALSYSSYSVIAPGCPATGCSITTALFQRPSVPQQNTDTQFNVRVDYTPSERDNVAVRYIHDRGFLTPDFGNNPSLPGFDSQQGGFSELAQVAETHVFGPRVLNEFRVSETRLNFLFAFTPGTLANPLAITPTISFAGTSLTNLGPNQNFPQGRGEDLYQLQDTVGINIGKQAIRAGADIGRQIEQEFVSQNALGTLAYSATGSYGGSIGEFINNSLGKSGTATKTFGKTRIDPHDWRSGIFLEDDIKLTPELTLNLGARYDYLSDPEMYGPPHDCKGKAKGDIDRSAQMYSAFGWRV
ncbi:outer membrane beta-barrel protein [Granulicella tundricola]|uniref:carboxypeptidase regulatory-like domain-containing protein n=1 Tax=Granulicella tundricola TaxID=940615 RepID=UPI0002F419D9|nr:carboxypeptidase regulatory-like domain-containing protein [Granulicella tundricola]